MVANGRPSDAAFARAGVLIAAAMYDLAERDAEAAEVERERHVAEAGALPDPNAQTGDPTRKPHNPPQSTPIEQIQTDPKTA
jgi:hypothetical protein